MKQKLIEKIESRAAVVGVIGLGYVGLPLLVEFARGGFRVIGLDVDREKVRQLQAGCSYIRHIPGEVTAPLFAPQGKASATDDFSLIGECDAVLICVPTPLGHHREPDLQYVTRTAETIAPHLRRGQLVVLESTTYPGTTEEILAPALESPGTLRVGRDLMLAYSPEREDPNNREYRTATIPKVIGGFDQASLEAATSLYGSIISSTVPVANCRTAEATKLMENIFRSVNIALVNELKTVFSDMDIDVWDVIGAASTKPFGFMPFYPGPGLGGHCIPIDPFYLTWKAREYGRSTRFIELAGEINNSMPEYVARNTQMTLNRRGKAMMGSRILLLGLAYKPNLDDDRESPSYRLWVLLEAMGAQVSYHDPYIPRVRPSREFPQLAGRSSVEWEAIAGESFDAAVVVTAHDGVDHDALPGMIGVVIDTRNACSGADNVVRS